MTAASAHAHTTLRLIWPQWQGAGTSSVRSWLPDLPFDQARRAYWVGSQVLAAVLPPHEGPTETVDVTVTDEGLELQDGVEAKSAVLESLTRAQAAIGRHDVDRILTLGGDCSVSVAPFAALAKKYPDDVAIVWLDAHPDISTPASEYPGFHSMALAALLGHGDPEIIDRLPATVPAERVAIAGLHAWFDDDISNVTDWGISTYTPDDLRTSSQPLLDWVAATGCSRVVIHLDVDVVDSNQIALGLGLEPDGLTTGQARRVVNDLAAASDVVGLTIAEYIPRQVLQIRHFLDGMPLLADPINPTATRP